MGSDASLQLETEQDGIECLNEAVRQIEQLEGCLSRFRPNSELMQLNARAGHWTDVSPVLYDVIRAARKAALITDGLYHPLLLEAMLGIGYDRTFQDIEITNTHALKAIVADWRDIELRPATHQVRIPTGSGLDLGGIGKGWSADRIANELSVYGPCLVNLGGDIAARGAPAGYHGWPVDVGDPYSSQQLASLNLSNRSVATSGIDYRHWINADRISQHHLINPNTGLSAQTDIQTATVIHANGASAEAFAKSVLIQGAQAGLAWLEQQWDSAGMVVKTNGEVIATQNFTSFITSVA